MIWSMPQRWPPMMRSDTVRRAGLLLSGLWLLAGCQLEPTGQLVLANTARPAPAQPVSPEIVSPEIVPQEIISQEIIQPGQKLADREKPAQTKAPDIKQPEIEADRQPSSGEAENTAPSQSAPAPSQPAPEAQPPASQAGNAATELALLTPPPPAEPPAGKLAEPAPGLPAAPPAEPLAKPAPPPPPPPPVFDPASVVGWTQEGLSRHIGAADFVRAEGQMRIWQYRSQHCVTDFFFYPASTGSDQDILIIAGWHIRPTNAGGNLSETVCFQELGQRL